MELKKPQFGSPCNHCGLCCRIEICPIGEIAFPGATAPCPGLVVEDGLSLCSLVATEISEGLKPKLQFNLAIGAGCSMPDDDTTEEEIAIAYDHDWAFVTEKYGSALPNPPRVL